MHTIARLSVLSLRVSSMFSCRQSNNIAQVAARVRTGRGLKIASSLQSTMRCPRRKRSLEGVR